MVYTLPSCTLELTRDFTVADVSRPLLGADFLRANSLLVDLHGKRLVHTETYHSTPLRKAVDAAPHLDAISVATDPYADLSRPPSQNEGDNTKKCLRLARNAGDKELVYYSYSMCSKNSFNATSKLAEPGNFLFETASSQSSSQSSL